jgi:hypothetical protein
MIEYSVKVDECLTFYKETDPEFAKILELRIAYAKVKFSAKEVKKATKKVMFVSNYNPESKLNAYLFIFYNLEIELINNRLMELMVLHN